MITFLFVALASLFGYLYRDLLDRVKKLEVKKPEVELGATAGAYIPNTPISNTSDVGISEPKSPQLIEWESREQLEKMQLDVIVKRGE